jgi:hypothetical protein
MTQPAPAAAAVPRPTAAPGRAPAAAPPPAAAATPSLVRPWRLASWLRHRPRSDASWMLPDTLRPWMRCSQVSCPLECAAGVLDGRAWPAVPWCALV